MKQKTKASEFDALPVRSRYFLARWKQEKNYGSSKEWDFGQLLELYFALTPHLRFDTSVERTRSDNMSVFFNNVFDAGEFLIAWDGTQPIDLLFYKLNTDLKRRIVQSKTFQASSVY